MNILVLQETDWLTRGPHAQQHIFERLSTNRSIKITVIDYDIEKKIRSESIYVKKRIYKNISRTIKKSYVEIIRTSHLQIPYLRRISSLITNFIELLKIFKRNKPDVIFIYSMTNGLIGLTLAKLYRIPTIFHYIDILHQLVPIKSLQGFARIVSRILFKLSDLILVYTPLQQRRVINEGAKSKKVLILPNGISMENTIVNKEKIDELKLRYKITENDFVIFFMGYLYEFAGLKEIIDYYNSKVKNGLLNLKFIIVGDGGIYNSLKNHIKSIGANWAILTGRIPYFNITEYLELADLCLLSFAINDITMEITPIKIIEYMAMKKPVISNSLPGLVIEIGKNNGVIFTKNQKELIEKLEDLAIIKEQLKEIGLRGYELVKNKYIWSKIIVKLNQTILELIKRKLNNE